MDTLLYSTASNVAQAKTLTAVEKENLTALAAKGVNCIQLLQGGATITYGSVPIKNSYGLLVSTRIITNYGANPSGVYYGQTYQNMFDQAKAYYKDNNLDFDKQIDDALILNGLKNVNVVAPAVDTVKQAVSNATAAVKSGVDVKPALLTLLDQMNLGKNHDAMYAFFSNASNTPAIQQATNKLGYPIPTTIGQDGVSEMLQLYWGAYYSNQFPVPEAVAGNCAQIAQSLTQLIAEKVNLSQAATQQNVESTFLTDSIMDTQMKLQAVQDLTTKFNGLYAKLSCTSAQGGKSNSVIGWAIIGVAVVIGIVVVKKIFHKQSNN